MQVQLKVVDSFTPPPMTITVDDVIAHLTAKLNTNRCEYDSNFNNVEKFVMDIENACMALMRSNRKIEAIKLLRTIFPVGLKDAKDYLESKIS